MYTREYSCQYVNPDIKADHGVSRLRNTTAFFYAWPRSPSGTVYEVLYIWRYTEGIIYIYGDVLLGYRTSVGCSNKHVTMRSVGPTGTWRSKHADRSMAIEACRSKHADRHMPIEACRSKHADRSMPTEACRSKADWDGMGPGRESKQCSRRLVSAGGRARHTRADATDRRGVVTRARTRARSHARHGAARHGMARQGTAWRGKVSSHARHGAARCRRDSTGTS